VAYRVTAAARETHDVVSLDLAPVAAPLPPARPGQFHMLWACGVGEVPLSASGLRPHRCTIRAVGPTTAALCARQPGDVVGVRGPFGTAWDEHDARGGDLVVVAGGIGLSPLRPAVVAALSHRARFGRIVVVAGAREPGELVHRADLDRWAARGAQVTAIVDRADEHWRGPVGLVTDALGAATFDTRTALALVCGPEPMMLATARALEARGVAPERIRLSLERNMQCATGWCGRCQLGGLLLCRDGAVVPYARVAADLEVAQR
jgi:NAD(P)H-flavin reductase